MIATLLHIKVFAYVLLYFSAATSLLYIFFLSLKIYRPEMLRISFATLHGVYLGLRITYGVLLGFGQYIFWSENTFTHSLTYLPLPTSVPLPGILKFFGPLLSQRHGYFVEYMLSHFWLEFLWGITFASLFIGLLWVMRKIRPLLFSALDLHVFFAACLLVGWPNALALVLLSFVLFVIFVIIKTIRSGGRTALYPAVIVACIFVYVFGDKMDRVVPFLRVLHFAFLR